MAHRSALSRDERILVREGRRHHRRSYSWTEFRIGIVALTALAAIVGWVAWRGAHPDPALFSAPVETLATGVTLPERTSAPSFATSRPTAASAADDVARPIASERGPLPADLSAAGWNAGPISTFDETDLFAKINGREGYYKSFGFERLWFVSLLSDADEAMAIDIETYDLGDVRNALGAYAGERPPGGAPIVDALGLSHLDRNALLVVRGRYYVRAIGADESAATVEQLERLRGALGAALPGEALPGAWAIFAGELGLDPGAIAYAPENAFSFGFATEVYSARLANDAEPFVTAREDEAAARALADRFVAGWRDYGEAAGESHGVSWTSDRYIHTFSGAKGVERWTIGVAGAPDLAAAEAALLELEAALLALPEGNRP